jgi:hypothetical protein
MQHLPERVVSDAGLSRSSTRIEASPSARDTSKTMRMEGMGAQQ